MYYEAKEFGNRIRRNIKAQGYTQEEFAEKVHISVHHLRNIMSGRRNCPYNLLVEISEVLNVSMDYLIAGVDRECDWPETSERLFELVLEMLKLLKARRHKCSI